jgi:hypothetical protein
MDLSETGWDYTDRWLLRRYAKSRKVAGSKLVEVNDLY